MPSMFLILLSSYLTNADLLKMVVINGEPTSYSSFSSLSYTWSSCVSHCYSLDSCVAVYSPDVTLESCILFEIGGLSTLTRGDTDKVLAIKMVSNSSDCPSSPTPMSGYSSTNTSYQSYSISQSGSTWTFSTSTSVSCPTDFKLFVRPLGPWCIGMISSASCITQADSVSECSSSYGGVLSGLQTVEENQWVLATGMPLLNLQTTYPKYGYWINGARKSSCMAPATRSSSCNGTNEFTYSDPLLSAYDGYMWGTGQPSGITSDPTTSNCVSINFSNTTNIGVDDYYCDQTNADSLCYKGYLCGVQPS